MSSTWNKDWFALVTSTSPFWDLSRNRPQRPASSRPVGPHDAPYVPLNERETMADIARLAGWPVILVVGMRLGCLSHALLTAEAVRGAGLALAGWVANAVDPQMQRLAENIATLDERLAALRLGSVPWLGERATPETAARYLDATRLFGGGA